MTPPDTRTLIVETALRLFEERGYAGTTMRAIATEAGLAPSNAYYWFASKDQLVQEFYLRIQVAHRERSAAALAAGGTLAERLRAVEEAFFEVIGPYHGFGAAFVGTAIAPGAAVSPFSEESSEAREISLGIFRDVVAGGIPGRSREADAGTDRPAVARAPERHPLLGDRHQPGAGAHAPARGPVDPDADQRCAGRTAAGGRPARRPGGGGARRGRAGASVVKTVGAPDFLGYLACYVVAVP